MSVVAVYMLGYHGCGFEVEEVLSQGGDAAMRLLMRPKRGCCRQVSIAVVVVLRLVGGRPGGGAVVGVVIVTVVVSLEAGPQDVPHGWSGIPSPTFFKLSSSSLVSLCCCCCSSSSLLVWLPLLYHDRVRGEAVGPGPAYHITSAEEKKYTRP